MRYALASKASLNIAVHQRGSSTHRQYGFLDPCHRALRQMNEIRVSTCRKVVHGALADAFEQKHRNPVGERESWRLMMRLSISD